MIDYLGTPDYRHGSPARAGVLLVNLGTPDEPTPAAVRRYLAEFLRDPRVIEMPRILWWPILHGVILRVRPSRSAHAYRKIWTAAGSPLLVESRAVAERLGARLEARAGERVQLELAMTYGQPSIADALERLRRGGVERLLVLPMYPQYSATTTASVFERVTTALARWRWIPEFRMVNQYWQEDAYVAAVADSVAAHWREHGRKHLLFSFHSIPKRYFLAGDPYHCFCQATARLVAERLGLASGDWSIGFQSRFGREEWLKPYVDHLLHDYAHSGRRHVTLVCPGFATDCLETLEEIDMRFRAAFLGHGGEVFDYVPCLNASDAQVALYEQLVVKHTHGWPEFAQSGGAELGDDAAGRDVAVRRDGASQSDDAARRAESRERALAQGARS